MVVCVCIVNYRTADLSIAAIRSAIAQIQTLGGSIMVVDNASQDGSAERISTFLQTLGNDIPVTLIESRVNGGFAFGNNLAFSAIRKMDPMPDAILLLNPDAELRPGALSEMLEVMKANPQAGFVGPRLENSDGTTWVAAFDFPSFTTEVLGGLGIDAISRHFAVVRRETNAPTRVGWVTGTATLIRREAFEDLGNMDDGYFLYFEEVDYMWNGQRLGWESWHAPQALVRHEAGASTGISNGRAKKGRQPDYWFQSWARFFAKNYGPVYARLTAAGKLCAILIDSTHKRLRGKTTGLPDKFVLDFARCVLFTRLSPPPSTRLNKPDTSADKKLHA